MKKPKLFGVEISLSDKFTGWLDDSDGLTRFPKNARTFSHHDQAWDVVRQIQENGFKRISPQRIFVVEAK